MSDSENEFWQQEVVSVRANNTDKNDKVGGRETESPDKWKTPMMQTLTINGASTAAQDERRSSPTLVHDDDDMLESAMQSRHLTQQ